MPDTTLMEKPEGGLFFLAFKMSADILLSQVPVFFDV